MQCPEEDDYECIPGIGKNPDYGLTNFDSIGGALVQTVRIIDQDYLENILNQVIAIKINEISGISHLYCVQLLKNSVITTDNYSIFLTNHHNFIFYCHVFLWNIRIGNIGICYSWETCF